MNTTSELLHPLTLNPQVNLHYRYTPTHPLFPNPHHTHTQTTVNTNQVTPNTTPTTLSHTTTRNTNGRMEVEHQGEEMEDTR